MAAMRTSGGGARDGLMTAIPLAMLIAFVLFMFGGPTATLRWLDQAIQGALDWAISTFR
jgi:hypothetical protein